jgi:PAS domain S-box-containing protein
VLAAALDPIVTLDSFGTVRFASESVRRVFGWSPAELIGRNINALVSESHRAAHDGYLANFRRTGDARILGKTRELEAVRRSGERFPIELSVARVESVSGSPSLFVAIIRDVGERRRLERELRLLKDLALSVGAASSVAEARRTALRLIGEATGWEHGEAWIPAPDGEAMVGVASWTAAARKLAPLAKSMAGVRIRRDNGLVGRAWRTGEVVWRANIGSLKGKRHPRCAAARRVGLRMAVAIPVLSEQRVSKVLLFFGRTPRRVDPHLLELARAAVAPLESLIQRKMTEARLDEYRRRLEAKVEEEARALRESQSRLRVADRLASIGTLAAGLGHDMNNVLLPVRAHLNALRACVESAGRRAGRSGSANHTAADRRAHLDQIGRSVTYLQQLADGLHYLAMDPEIDSESRRSGETTDLRHWWSQTGVLISKAVPRHVRVSASIPGGLPRVRVALHRLTQAVLNLVVNAGEAIPPPADRRRRQGRVRVSALLDQDSASVRLAVADNGRGMTDEVKRRAFEMFFTTKVRGLGTGLGLALVNKVAVSAGGRVELDSTLGTGTTVTVVLPVEAGAPARSGPRAVVSISDGRAGALIRQILDAGGASVAAGMPARADIWVVDPAETALAEVRSWRRSRPGGRLVLFGAPDSAVADWNELRPLIVERRDAFETLRSTLGRALIAR